MIDVKALRPASQPAFNAEDVYSKSQTDLAPSRWPAMLVLALASVAIYLSTIFPSLSKADAEAPLARRAEDETGEGKTVAADEDHPEDETGSLAKKEPEPDLPVGSGGPGADLAGLTLFTGIESRLIDYEQLPLPRFRPAAFENVFGRDRPGNDNLGIAGPVASGSGARTDSGSGSGFPTVLGVSQAVTVTPGSLADGSSDADGLQGGSTETPGAPPVRVTPVNPPVDEDENDDAENPEEPGPRNRAPRLGGAVVLADFGTCQVYLITIAALLSGAVDDDGDQLSVLALRTSSGELTPTDGGWTFRQSEGFTGPVTLDYDVSDGQVAVGQTASFSVMEFSHIVGTPGNDILLGTMCADVITSCGGDDNIDARDGNDIVQGGSGNDHILAGAGDDTVYAGAGDDVVFGGLGADLIFGGEGDDRLYGEDGDDRIEGEGGNDLILGGAGNDQLSGGAGNDKIHGDDGDDVISADDGDDIVSGGIGDDTINGGAGADLIAGGAGDDVLVGGAGDDIIMGDDGDDIIDAGEGDDDIDAGSGDNLVLTGAGNNRVGAGDGNNTVTAGSGVDHIRMGAGNDVVVAGAGADIVAAGAGHDRLFGEDGNDTIFAEAGDDVVSGGDGDDHLIGGAGADIIDGDDGDDIVDAGSGDDVVDAGDGSDIVLAGAGQDRVDGGDGADRLDGQAGADRIDGGKGSDVIEGAAGDDCLDGSDGNDVVLGGDGADMIEGGKGDDTLEGGNGRDIILAGDGDDLIVATLDADCDIYDGENGEDTLDLSSAMADIDIDLVAGTAIGIEIGHDKIVDLEAIIGGSGDDQFIVGARAMSLTGGEGDDTFTFDVSCDDEDRDLIHKILDLQPGDRIEIMDYQILQDVDDNADPQFEGTYGDAEDGSEQPFRFRIEKIGNDSMTFIDVFIEQESDTSFTIEIDGSHRFHYA